MMTISAWKADSAPWDTEQQKNADSGQDEIVMDSPGEMNKEGNQHISECIDIGEKTFLSNKTDKFLA